MSEQPQVRVYHVNPQQLAWQRIQEMVSQDAERGIAWAKCHDCGDPYPVGSTDGPLVLAVPYVRGQMFCSKDCEQAFAADLLGGT